MARPRQFDEERVLRAIRDQFWDAGYAATSLEDLVHVSGLGKDSLYAAFGDKHQLFLRALRSYTDVSRGSVVSGHLHPVSTPNASALQPGWFPWEGKEDEMPGTLTPACPICGLRLRTECFSTCIFAKTIWSERTSRNRITTIQVTPGHLSSRLAAIQQKQPACSQASHRR
jgi:AcrR family transcriptional regulator